MRSLRPLLRMTAVRLSALYLLLFGVCAIALIFYVTSHSVRLLEEQTKEDVRQEIRELSSIYRQGGITALARSVDRRSRAPGAKLYAIADSNGRLLGGNVRAISSDVLTTDGWTDRPFRYEMFAGADAEAGHLALAQIIALPNGLRMLIGRDLGEPERFRELVRRALVLALGFMAAGALLIWLFVGRRALQRIDQVSSASERIVGGDLSQRLPISGADDEFDRLSHALNAMLTRIEGLNRGLREVSDNIAHDLKTPLTRLRNRAEEALADDSKESDYRAALESMIAESDQMIKTFNALLMIARVEAGSSVAELEPTDIGAVARDVVDLYEPVVEDAGGALDSQIERGLSVSGNRELLAQALTNLIDNALKHGIPDGGEPITIFVKAYRAGDAIHLAVSDGGEGIPEKDRSRVKERFVRLDASRSRPGLGLGLSLVDAIAKMHDGRLELGDAEPGTVAKLVLKPLAKAA